MLKKIQLFLWTALTPMLLWPVMTSANETENWSFTVLEQRVRADGSGMVRAIFDHDTGPKEACETISNLRGTEWLEDVRDGSAVENCVRIAKTAEELPLKVDGRVVYELPFPTIEESGELVLDRRFARLHQRINSLKLLLQVVIAERDVLQENALTNTKEIAVTANLMGQFDKLQKSFDLKLETLTTRIDVLENGTVGNEEAPALLDQINELSVEEGDNAAVLIDMHPAEEPTANTKKVNQEKESTADPKASGDKEEILTRELLSIAGNIILSLFLIGTIAMGLRSEKGRKKLQEKLEKIETKST